METEKGSGGRSFAAGFAGGAFAVVVIVAAAVVVARRAGPHFMARMMRGCCDSEEMRACMDKCGCGKADDSAAE
jgi:hypothetical protein